MKFNDIAKKILSILFPEFSNKLTWAVILCGITLISSPLLEQIIREFINKKFHLNLTDGNDAIIGVIVIALGLLHNYGFVRVQNMQKNDTSKWDERKRILKHDKGIFEKLSKLVNERHLKDYVNNIMRVHSFISTNDEPLDTFCYEGRDTDYIFINPTINTAKDEFYKSCCKFREFLSLNFFPHGPNLENDKLYMCMYPELNIDRGGNPTSKDRQKYDKYAKELFQLGNKVISNFISYRLSVKNEYSI